MQEGHPYKASAAKLLRNLSQSKANRKNIAQSIMVTANKLSAQTREGLDNDCMSLDYLSKAISELSKQ